MDDRCWQRAAGTGRWIAPDLRGHGASAHARDYSLAEHAADIAELVDGTDEIIVLGHSMGGAVALALASGKYGIAPSQVFGLGIKVAWNDDELAGMRKMAASQPRLFETRDEAVARYLKVSGLHGLATGFRTMASRKPKPAGASLTIPRRPPSDRHR